MVATQDLSIVMADDMMSIYAPDNGDYWDAMHGIAGASWDEGNIAGSPRSIPLRLSKSALTCANILGETIGNQIIYRLMS